VKTCAVIPAAGRGARLRLDRPKILAPLSSSETIWSVLRRKLLAMVDHIHVILSPEGERLFRQALAGDCSNGRISIGIQHVPAGMGDAIFCGYDVWCAAKTLLVIWGDQVFVSEKTLCEALGLHGASPRTLVLPVVSLPTPYVEYIFDPDGRLAAVRQSREGEQCGAGGWNDIGTFVLSVNGLKEVWERYLSMDPKGRETGEINFLPFLPFLSRNGWRVRRLIVDDAREARGINTADDLRFFQELWAP
jgi:bifunctional UDP-N-acetylglucosamine pyrophosphorylase / glucosamine-1-phosphate N-acetyltransferase